MSRDATGLASTFSADGIYIDDPHPRLGRDTLANFLHSVSWRNFPDMTFTTVSVYGDGHRFTWEWIMHVTGSGVIAGSEGKKIAVPGVDLLELRDGLVCRAITYFDRKALWDAVLS